MNLNMEFAIKNNLDVKDVTVISLLDLISKEKGKDEFDFSYSEIINHLPFIFDGVSMQSNTVRLRRILDKEGMQNFVTRSIRNEGPHKGRILTFKLNKENIKKLNVEGIVN